MKFWNFLLITTSLLSLLGSNDGRAMDSSSETEKGSSLQEGAAASGEQEREKSPSEKLLALVRTVGGQKGLRINNPSLKFLKEATQGMTPADKKELSLVTHLHIGGTREKILKDSETQEIFNILLPFLPKVIDIGIMDCQAQGTIKWLSSQEVAENLKILSFIGVPDMNADTIENIGSNFPSLLRLSFMDTPFDIDAGVEITKIVRTSSGKLKELKELSIRGTSLTKKTQVSELENAARSRGEKFKLIVDSEHLGK